MFSTNKQVYKTVAQVSMKVAENISESVEGHSPITEKQKWIIRLFFFFMLLCFVSMVSYVITTTTHAEDGFYDGHMYHLMANGSTSDSEDFVLNGHKLLKKNVIGVD